MDVQARQQLAMKILDEAFLQGGMIFDQLGTIERDDNAKKNNLRQEAIKLLLENGYAEYQSKGVYKATPSGMQTAKNRRK